jgi:hypothetical protein
MGHHTRPPKAYALFIQHQAKINSMIGIKMDKRQMSKLWVNEDKRPYQQQSKKLHSEYREKLKGLEEKLHKKRVDTEVIRESLKDGEPLEQTLKLKVDCKVQLPLVYPRNVEERKLCPVNK